jgi:hypothetical protein
MDVGDPNDLIFIPGKETTVVRLNPKCPRDRIIETLTEIKD